MSIFFEKRKKEIVAAIFVVLLVVCLLGRDVLAASIQIGAPKQVNSMISSEITKHNFVKLTTSGGEMHIEAETPLEGKRFGINVRRVSPASSSSTWLAYAYPTNKGSYYSFSKDIDLSDLSGDYVLVITRTYPDGSGSSVFYKNANFRVKNKKVSLLQYDDVVEQNYKIKATGDSADVNRFKDPYLSEFKNLLFRDPKTGKVNALTDSKVSYIKRVADRVIGEASSDYEKALKIYEFIADEYYYDDVAFSTGKNQYLDPYRNLYNLRNNVTSENSSKGRVATVCVGHAGMVIALARAEGIPARMINGHHVGLGTAKYNNWSTEPNVDKVDHWWAELYVNDEWIVVDPTAGSANRWNSSTNKWTYNGISNYVSFAPTIEQFSASYIAYNTFGGSDNTSQGGSSATLSKPVVKISNIPETGKIRLTWSAVNGANKYEIYMSTSKNGTYTKLYTTTGSVLNHTSAKAGTTYYYKVKAVGNNASSDYSAIVLRACDYASPKLKVSNTAATGKIRLTWDAVSGASKYEIYMSTSKNGTYTKLYTTTGKVLNHTSAKAGTTYYYKARALGSKESATSAYSTIVSGQCL